MTTLVSPMSTRPIAVVDRDLAQLVPLAQLGRQLGHDLLGHALVRLVLEVEHVAAARARARRADERRDRARRRPSRTSRDGVLDRERLLGEPEVATRDGWDHARPRRPPAAARPAPRSSRLRAYRSPAGSSPSPSAGQTSPTRRAVRRGRPRALPTPARSRSAANNLTRTFTLQSVSASCLGARDMLGPHDGDGGHAGRTSTSRSTRSSARASSPAGRRRARSSACTCSRPSSASRGARCTMR